MGVFKQSLLKLIGGILDLLGYGGVNKLWGDDGDRRSPFTFWNWEIFGNIGNLLILTSFSAQLKHHWKNDKISLFDCMHLVMVETTCWWQTWWWSKSFDTKLRVLLPRKTNRAMENPAFEDVFPIAMLVFSAVTISEFWCSFGFGVVFP